MVVQGKRSVGKLNPLLSKVSLQNPARRNNVVVTPDDGITPLDDAAYLHVGEGEGLHLGLEAMAFYDCLVKRLSGKRGNLAVGRNDSGFQVCDMSAEMVFCMERNFYIGIAFAFFGENLDPPVFVTIFLDVVGDGFMVENDGSRVAGLSAGQTEVFLGNRLPIIKSEHGRRRKQENTGKNTQDAQEDTSLQLSSFDGKVITTYRPEQSILKEQSGAIQNWEYGPWALFLLVDAVCPSSRQ